MNSKQEPKYLIDGDGKLRNRSTNKPIPPDEPLFILRAKDAFSVNVLNGYLDQLYSTHQSPEHIKAVELRLGQFQKFQKENPDRVKNPTTTLTDDWKNL